MHLPTQWQFKTIYAALTALAILAICWVSSKFLLVVMDALGFLQPLLIPFAVAGVLAYLLEPLVKKLCAWKLSRTNAVLCVFGVFTISATLIIVWITPVLYQQGTDFWGNMPLYVEKTRQFIMQNAQRLQDQYANNAYIQNSVEEAATSLQKALPDMANNIGKFAVHNLGGVLGAFGFVFGLIIIPFYLFYFLKEGVNISKNWSNYLPLQASKFKDEVVDALTEINGYLIAFFRGQLLVSAIDGLLIGVGLFILGLKAGLLIGLLVVVLGLIPYLGMLLCWIPAVIIAAVQFNDWKHPLIVTAIFIGMNQLDGWLIAPKIVGKSVGLHPLTVIASVIGWSLLFGGLLGAILAVPLTATLKVLLKRYIWQKRFDSNGRHDKTGHAHTSP
jgi:predicted PurR-regulated permease PerM